MRVFGEQTYEHDKQIFIVKKKYIIQKDFFEMRQQNILKSFSGSLVSPMTEALWRDVNWSQAQALGQLHTRLQQCYKLPYHNMGVFKR